MIPLVEREALPTILASLGAQTHASSQCVAVQSEHRMWTFRELDMVSTELAVRLVKDGLQPGDRVGLCVDRSVEAIASMLGVMKAGGAFVPLDPEYPADRLAYMVEDAQVRCIIGQDDYRSAIGLSVSSDVKWVDVMSIGDDSVMDRIRNFREFACTQTSELLPVVTPESLAYIMYTSGSTGKPKGVKISHEALAVYCDADIDVYCLTKQDRTLQFSTLCFDIAIEEIFPPLLAGGRVVVRPKERSSDRNELSSIINQFRITAVHLATAYWHQWVDLMVAAGDQVPESLRLVIATGEKVSVEHFKRWQSICDQDVLWCNAYGPTEATVSATVFIPGEGFDSPHMPIGKPLKRYSAFILDDELQPVIGDQTGHLFIGGPALAMGYHRRDELTAKAFVNVDIEGKNQRIYRTGDLARWLPDGNIDFAGRVDHQIKLGSYRIEPGEIEAVLNRCPAVLESLVTYDEVDGQKFLIAYVAGDENRLESTDVAAFLRTELPPYMVPTRYAFMQEFPKTVNGKIDRDELPDPSIAVNANSSDCMKPRDEFEAKLVELWQQVLNVSGIGIHDDFFLLGGSSLLVTQVVTKLITEMEIELPVRDFFANPTVATLARHLQSLNGQPCSSQSADADLQALRARLPVAEPHFFESDGNEIYAIDYRPPSGTTQSAVVLCHPIGHEYTRAYRNMQQLAVTLCRQGHHVLRFDYFASGNSDGTCEQLTFQTMAQNLVDAHAHLKARTQAETIDVIGLRMGATIAASVPAGLFGRTILWDPVVSGERMLDLFDEFHSRQLSDLTRYNAIRLRGKLDQSYGHTMTEEKRLSIGAANLPDLDKSTWVLYTEESLSSETELAWLNSQDHQLNVGDEIYWEHESYTESAFSSPKSFEAIADLLKLADCSETSRTKL